MLVRTVLFLLAVSVSVPVSAGADHFIHPDCRDNDKPQQCTRAIEKLTAELQGVNAAYASPTVDGLASYYHPLIIHYVRSTRTFARGQAELRQQILEPFVAAVESASLDFSGVRFRYVHPDLVIAYGRVPGQARLRNGLLVPQPPLPQTMTWIRNQGQDHERPFLLVAFDIGTYDGGPVPAAGVRTCDDHPQRNHCEHIVADLRVELERINEAFDPLNVDEAVRFYDTGVIHYVSSTDSFYRGRDELREGFFEPFAAFVEGARLGFSAYSFQVLDQDLIITYGAIAGEGTFTDGTPFVQPPLPQIVTWVRNPDHDPKRPWVVVADHE